MWWRCATVFLLLSLMTRCIGYLSGDMFCFYVCCSDCVGVCGNVCCVVAIVKDSVFSLGVLKYDVLFV